MNTLVESNIKSDLKHGIAAYSRHGCRCSVCKEAARNSRIKAKNKFYGTEPNKHGTAWAYRTCGCRCETCVLLHSKSAEKTKISRKNMMGKIPKVHGRSGYELYGCRCEICVAGHKRAHETRGLNINITIGHREKTWEKIGIKNFKYSDYISMYENQNGKCDICGKFMEIKTTNGSVIKKNKVANVDHDHNTGEVRALLCNSCNMMIGCGRNYEILLKGADYLEKHKGELN